MTAPRPPRRLTDDDGALSLLIVGFAFLAALMVVVTTSASAVFLARRDLVSVVDGAAIAAAQQIDADALYERASNARLPLSEAAAEEVVARLAAAHPEVSFGRPVVDGDTVVVTAEREVNLRFAAVLGITRWTVRASARAQSPLR
ncbi:MAG TPA: hypothetical protein VNA12_05265 [Mycobacteriales bacterium]|nr:hypothetical protein [Mycobacteriales bacterium]